MTNVVKPEEKKHQETPKVAPEPKPEPLEYPKMLYKRDVLNRTVANEKEQKDAEAEGWKEKV